MRAARGLALDQLHHHIARFDIEQRADIRMVQRGDGAGFVLEAGAHILALGDLVSQDFDRDCTAEPRVGSLVDLAHPACSDGGRGLQTA